MPAEGGARQIRPLGAKAVQSGLAAGNTVVLRGGGGVGAGAEYLMENGEEFTPHALSTQAGFQFSYEIQRPSPGPKHIGSGVDPDLEDAYALLGEFYRTATDEAYDDCGRDYSKFSCMCPKTHATVICLMGRELGDPAKIPPWLQEQHCPGDAALLTQQVNGLTSYQQLLLNSASVPPSPSGATGGTGELSCHDVLLEYFGSLNAPASGSD